MIPIYIESTHIKECFPHIVENCTFCKSPTRTWHENTNNPCCINCAKVYKVSDFPEDHGKIIRKQKRKGTFNRGDSVRAN